MQSKVAVELNSALLEPSTKAMKLSVGTQLAIVTVSVLFCVTTLFVLVLASQQRQQTLASKQAAAMMVTDLFASSAAAGVVFKDVDAVKAMLENLRATDDVVGAAVFEVSATTPLNPKAVGSFGESILPVSNQPIEVIGERLIVTRPIVDSDAKQVGIARVAFSLAREYKAVARTQHQLAIGGLLMMLITAALLIGFSRARVLKPLMHLVRTAKQIEQGELKARVPEEGNIEIATLARAFNSMGDAIADRERQLRGELQVAADLQLSILPKLTSTTNIVEGIEVAAMMKPATEVGGDYYDVIPTQDGCWVGIGDVSGHGLGAGVIMLMIQAAVAALVAAKPDLSPTDVECAVNRVLYQNIRERMGRRDHATLSILRYWNDGRVAFAGAHEDILVYRAATGKIDSFETPGTWVGAKKDVRDATTDSSFELGASDVLVLYTDGITEARAKNGEQFGIDRLMSAIRNAAKGAGTNASTSAFAIRDAVLESVAMFTEADATTSPLDDVSIVVMRQLQTVYLREGPETSAASVVLKGRNMCDVV